MDIASIITNTGFAAGVAIYLLQREAKDKERIIVALEKATDVINQNTKVLEKIKDAS